MRSEKDSLRVIAESALVLAARLDPASSQPPYLLAVATLWPAYRKALNSWGNHDVLKRLTTQQRTRIDSLMLEAWLREPFYDIELEPLLTLGPLPGPERGWNRLAKAYLAYQSGQYSLALDLWSQEIARKPERIDLRFHRVHTFYRLKEYKSATAELRDMLALIMPTDSETRAVLPRTDILFYSLGIAYERAGQPDLAKEAYGQALVANLGIYMAHARLANILLAEGDTTLALQEVAVALDLAPRDPLLIALSGSMLLRVGRFAQALEQFRTVMVLSPRYATPYFLTGMVSDSLQRDGDALQSFQSFLERAPRRDERRTWAEQRVAPLRKTLTKAVDPHE